MTLNIEKRKLIIFKALNGRKCGRKKPNKTLLSTIEMSSSCSSNFLRQRWKQTRWKKFFPSSELDVLEILGIMNQAFRNRSQKIKYNTNKAKILTVYFKLVEDCLQKNVVEISKFICENQRLISAKRNRCNTIKFNLYLTVSQTF